MSNLILIRHGQSVWNAANRFTGWTDVELSEVGVSEAEEAGRSLSSHRIDVVHTSDLIRAQRTAEIIMSLNESSEGYSTKFDWRLNERNYGSLQGLNKAETAEKFGAEQVHIWRRSFDVAPPDGESLEMTAERTIPYFEEDSAGPASRKGRTRLGSWQLTEIHSDAHRGHFARGHSVLGNTDGFPHVLRVRGWRDQ